MNRQELKDQYDEAIKAQENHLVLAKRMIAKGTKVMLNENASVEQTNAAHSWISRGTTLQTTAQNELIKLKRERPR